MFATSARGRWMALTLLIVISALALGITSTQATDPNLRATRLAADGSPAVALIGDEPIGATEFEQTVGAVRSNLDYMYGQIASNNQSSAMLQAFSGLITAHGVETVAFASMIETHALYNLAVARGYAPSDDTVQSRVQQDKALAAQSNIPALAAYIASVGEDRFWTELYPELVRRQLATQTLWQNTAFGKPTYAEQAKAWNDVQQQALAATHITVLDADAIAPASTEAAIAYLHDYWQFMAQVPQ